jgi:hypothetical protein
LPPRGAAIQKNARLITQTAKMCSSLPLKNMYYVHIAFLLDTGRYAPARLISISTAGLAPLEAAELGRYPLFQSVIITCPNHIEVNSSRWKSHPFFYHTQLFVSYLGPPSVSTENLRIQNNSEDLDFFGHRDDRYDHLRFMRDTFMKYGH